MGFLIFWDVAHCWLVVSYWCFRDNLLVLPSRVKLEDPEDGTDRLSRNVSPTTDQCCVTFQKNIGLICTGGSHGLYCNHKVTEFLVQKCMFWHSVEGPFYCCPCVAAVGWILYSVRFEVFVLALLKIQATWVVMLCWLVIVTNVLMELECLTQNHW